MSKLLEKLVARTLLPFFKQVAALNPHQFGFRKAHTTLDLLTHLCQTWANELAEGNEVRAVALDIRKAFDTV